MQEPVGVDAVEDGPRLRDAADAKEYLHGLYPLGMKLDLDNITMLAERLGNPHRAYPSIHVAGTNGKGSVCQMLAAPLREAGLKVGVYTSPHLVEMNERIVVDGQAIADMDVLALTRRLLPLVREVAIRSGGHPTFFEVVTAMAFEYFRLARVDIAVIEVGLGGRLDSTNIIEPAACCITTIGHDHTQILGSTLANIAREKAGIIKPGVPVVTGVSGKESLQVIEDSCRERGAPLHLARHHIMRADRPPKGGAAGTFAFSGPNHEFSNVPLPLRGAHQLENAACALTLLDVLEPERIGLDAAAYGKRLPDWVRTGFGRLLWAGRLQKVLDAPLLVIDGSHNPPGMRSLAAALPDVFGPERFDVVFGVMGDKDLKGILVHLHSFARSITAVAPNVKRSLPAGDLELRIRDWRSSRAGEGRNASPLGHALPAVRSSADLRGELERILEDRNGRYLVTGSIFLAGEVMGCLMDMGAATAMGLGLPPQGEAIVDGH